MRLHKSTVLASLLLGRKAVANLDSILISRDITLLTKVHIVKAMVFSVVMYGCELLFSCSVVSDSATPWTTSMPGFPVLHHLPEFAQTHVHWVSDAIQTSRPVIPFYSHLQSFPASGSFPMSQFFTSGGQSIGASVSASVLPMKIQGWFLLGLTGLISLQSKGLSRVFSNTTVKKHQIFSAQPFLWASSHIRKGLLAKP